MSYLGKSSILKNWFLKETITIALKIFGLQIKLKGFWNWLRHKAPMKQLQEIKLQLLKKSEKRLPSIQMALVPIISSFLTRITRFACFPNVLMLQGITLLSVEDQAWENLTSLCPQDFKSLQDSSSRTWLTHSSPLFSSQKTILRQLQILAEGKKSSIRSNWASLSLCQVKSSPLT